MLFALHFGDAGGIDQPHFVRIGPGRPALAGGGAADHVGAKRLPTGERVEQTRLAAADAAERHDLQPLRRAFGFELRDRRLDFRTQPRRAKRILGMLPAPLQIVAQLRGPFDRRKLTRIAAAASVCFAFSLVFRHSR